MAFQIANQTSTSLLRPIPAPGPWVRPPDWLTITDTPGEVQFLFSDAVNAFTAVNINFTRGATGDIYIDWGDSTTDIVSVNGTTNHTYATGGTPSTLGYNMWKIRVYGDPGTTITNCVSLNNLAYYNSVVANSGLLEAIYGDGTQTNGFNSMFTAGTRPTYAFLEHVKLPDTCLAAGFIFFRAFYQNCPNLAKLVLPTSCPNATSCTSAFENLFSLREIVFPQDMVGVTSLEGAFFNCNSLTSVKFPPLFTVLTGLGSTFSGCASLTSITIPPGPYQSLSSTFSGCRNLLSVEIPPFASSTGLVNLTQTFINATALEYVKMPSSGSGFTLNLTSTFQGAVNLKNITFPPDVNISTITSAFSGCSSLATCVLPTSTPALTNLNSAFLNCSTLQEITLPVPGATAASFVSTFQNCLSLGSVEIPSSYTISSLNLTFSGCANLRTLTLPNNTQDSLTTMLTMAGSCINLKTVTLPTSMTALTDLSNVFSGCRTLTEVVFPASLNSVTTMASSFDGCQALQYVTYPTSMSALTNLSFVHRNNTMLRSVVFPNTVSAGMTTFQQAFDTSRSLNFVSFPSTQMTGVTTIGTTFQLTQGGTGFVNLDKIGNNSTGATVYLNGFGNVNSNFPDWNFSCKFSRLELQGIPTVINKVATLRLTNTGSGQWGGASPQINVSYTSMSTAALNTLFADMAAQGAVVSKTINITGAVGAAGLTAADRLVITSIGWTITG